MGWFHGDLRDYRRSHIIAMDVAATLLDLAETHGRLTPAARPAWEAWVAEAVDLIAGQPPPGADDRVYLEDLAGLGVRVASPALKTQGPC